MNFSFSPQNRRMKTGPNLFNWLFAGLFMGLASTLVQGADMPEERLKALYLVNIATFVRWDNSDDEISLCIWRDSDIYSHLDGLGDIEIGGKRRLRLHVDPVDAGKCKMIYLDSLEQVGMVKQSLHPALLIVTDRPTNEDLPADIHLFIRNLKLRFSVNQKVLKQKDFKISSKLLRLARQVD